MHFVELRCELLEQVTTKTGYHRTVNELFATAINRKIRLN